MRKLYFLILFPLVWISCSSPSNYEKAIIDYLETDKKGVRTDLQIEFLSIDVSDIIVADSITILQKQFEAEKTKKIESIQNSISHLQEKIQEQKGRKIKLSQKHLSLDGRKALRNTNPNLPLLKIGKLIT